LIDKDLPLLQSIEPGAQMMLVPSHAAPNLHHKPTLTTLPVEVLDKILAHLLDMTLPEYSYDLVGHGMMARRCGDTACRNYTTLLRVNKHFARAAELFVYTQHRFVILDLDSGSTEIMIILRHGYVEHVANKHLASFEKHIAHVQWTATDTKSDSVRILLLASQLDAFLRRAKYLDHREPLNHICVESRADEPLLRSALSKVGPSAMISITLRLSAIGGHDIRASKTRNIRKTVLEPFKILCSNAIRIKVHDATSDTLESWHREDSHKRIVFADAVGHDFLSFILAWEQELIHEVHEELAKQVTDPSFVAMPAGMGKMRRTLDYFFLASTALMKLNTPGWFNSITAEVLGGAELSQLWQYKLLVTAIDLNVTAISLLYHCKPERDNFHEVYDYCQSHVEPFHFIIKSLKASGFFWPRLPTRLRHNVETVLEGNSVRDMDISTMDFHISDASIILESRCKTWYEFDVPAHYVGWCDTTHNLNDDVRKKLNEELDEALKQ